MQNNTKMHEQVQDFFRIKKYVKGIMENKPIHAYSQSNIKNILSIMKKSNLSNIAIVGSDFSFLGTITEDELKENINLKNESLSKNLLKPLFLYPNTSVEEANAMMEYLKVKEMPVLSSPWERKLVGYFKKQSCG